jgi:hypothetical protein
MTNLKKKSISLILTLTMMITFIPMFELPVNAVTTVSALQTAINNAPNNVATTINVTGNITLTSQLIIPENKNVIIRSSGSTRTLTRGISGNLIIVRANATLTLADIIVDGNRNFTKTVNGALVFVNGDSTGRATFNMNNGAILQNNLWRNGVPFQSQAGAVDAHSDGIFNMNGGIIRSNTGDVVGGVLVCNTFTMRGGEITGNGGGVRTIDNVYSAFTRQFNNGTFNMYGGTIRNNTNSNVSGSGTFNRSGGTVGNTTVNNGIIVSIQPLSRPDAIYLLRIINGDPRDWRSRPIDEDLLIERNRSYYTLLTTGFQSQQYLNLHVLDEFLRITGIGIGIQLAPYEREQSNFLKAMSSDLFGGALEAISFATNRIWGVGVTGVGDLFSAIEIVNKNLNRLFYELNQRDMRALHAYLNTTSTTDWELVFSMGGHLEWGINDPNRFLRVARHVRQLYLSTGRQISRIVTVKCPVELEIYDKDKNLIALLGNEEAGVLFNEHGHFYVVEVEGSSDFKKIAHLFDDEYEIRINGVGTGSMDLTIEELQNDGTWKALHTTVDVTDSTEMRLIFDDDDMSLLNNEESDEFVELPLSEIIIERHTVDVSHTSGGLAFGEGEIKSGEEVFLSARSFDDYIFDGWYENNGFISNEEFYSFTILTDRTFEARFSLAPVYKLTYDLNGGTSTTPIETDRKAGSYFAIEELTDVTPPLGKQLKEWNTNSNGTETSYFIGDVVRMPRNNLTLYAIWVDCTHDTPSASDCTKCICGVDYSVSHDPKTTDCTVCENCTTTLDPSCTANPLKCAACVAACGLLGHSYDEAADCMTCEECGSTRERECTVGNPCVACACNHNWNATTGLCNTCSTACPVTSSHGDTVNCGTSDTCGTCGYVTAAAGAHTWNASTGLCNMCSTPCIATSSHGSTATCGASHTCGTCGYVTSATGEHSRVNACADCSVCGDTGAAHVRINACANCSVCGDMGTAHARTNSCATCSICGDVGVAHNWNAITGLCNTCDALCTATSSHGSTATCGTSDTCGTCGYVTVELGHTTPTGTWTSGTAANCINVSTRIETCAKIGCIHTIATETQAAFGHTWNATTGQCNTCSAPCTATLAHGTGVNCGTGHTCTTCGFVTAALTHTWVTNANGTHNCATVGGCNITNETCSPNGISDECIKCHYITPDPTCLHPNTTTAYDPAPTCTSGGARVVTCDDCYGTISSGAVEALDHVIPTAWTVRIATICGTAGVEYRVCSRGDCNHEETQAIAALEHNYGAWSVTTPATATTDGVETRTCTLCNEPETRPIPATDNGGGTTTPPNNDGDTITPPNNDTTTPPSGNTTTPPTGGDTTTPPVIDDMFITQILKQDNPVLDLSQLDSTVLSAEDLQAIKASGKDVTIILESGFTFVIKANSIQPWAKDFDLNIAVELTSRATEIDGVKIPANAIVINPNFSGEFGFEIAFTFTAEQLAAAGINGNNVKLFHIDHDGNVTDMGRARLNADGSVEIVISHASFYVLSEQAPTAEEAPTSADESDTTTTTPPTSTEDGNPATGVMLGMTAAILAGGVAVFSRKRKKYNNIIRN